MAKTGFPANALEALMLLRIWRSQRYEGSETVGADAQNEASDACEASGPLQLLVLSIEPSPPLRPHACHELVAHKAVNLRDGARDPVLRLELAPQLTRSVANRLILESQTDRRCQSLGSNLGQPWQLQAGARLLYQCRIVTLVESTRCDNRGAAASQRSGDGATTAMVDDRCALGKKPLMCNGLYEEHVGRRICKEVVAVRLASQAILAKSTPAAQDHGPH
mmetsp:Transcript_36123/g.104040  ORF Transcript_36123/g.104040 Transcript_36123/m.104040 type:complete len:221 (+) Transcript_36123:108-770(+)